MRITRNDHAFTSRDLKGTNLEPTYSGALSFMRRKYSKELADVDVVVSGFPLDTATTNRPGARFGPRAIRAASSNNAWNRPYGAEFDPFDRLAVIDYGDCHWDHGRPEEIPAAIEAHAAHVLESGASLLALGGDHFISYPLLKAYAKRHGPLSLIHFDAHSDTWDDAEGAGRVDHGTMFYHAAKDGLVDARRSVQIGLRTHNDDLMGFNVLDAPWVHENGGAKTAAEVRRIVGGHGAYLTFDIDCLDPSFAPGTGTPVPGGLSSAQAIAILRGLAGIRFLGMDIVEVAPAYDVSEITALAAAHLAHEWLALYALGRSGRD
jgi:agmatinase